MLNSVTEAAALARALAVEGWHVHEGFVLPDEPWEVADNTTLLVGYVDDAAAAADAVLAAERGAAVIATVDSGSDIEALLVADLSRIGPVTRSS